MIQRLFRFPRPIREVYSPIWLIILVVLLGVDLWTKKWSTDNLNFHLSSRQIGTAFVDQSFRSLYDGHDKIDIFGEDGSLVKFRLVFNDRFVFGSGPALPIGGFLLTLTAILFLVFYRLHNPTLGHRWAWVMVFSGALGNLVDKMFVKSLTTREWKLSIVPQEGYVNGVVDFVECIWFGWSSFSDVPLLSFLAWQSWPTFNFADSLIVVGIGLLLVTMNLAPEEPEKKSAEESR